MLTAQRAICYHPSFRFGGKATTAKRMKKDCQRQNCSALKVIYDLYYSAMLQSVLPLGVSTVSNKDGVGKCQYLENGRRYVQSYYQWLIGSCIIMRFRLTIRSISQKWVWVWTWADTVVRVPADAQLSSTYNLLLSAGRTVMTRRTSRWGRMDEGSDCTHTG